MKDYQDAFFEQVMETEKRRTKDPKEKYDWLEKALAKREKESMKDVFFVETEKSNKIYIIGSSSQSIRTENISKRFTREDPNNEIRWCVEAEPDKTYDCLDCYIQNTFEDHISNVIWADVVVIVSSIDRTIESSLAYEMSLAKFLGKQIIIL